MVFREIYCGCCCFRGGVRGFHFALQTNLFKGVLMTKDVIVSDDTAKKFAREKETPYTRWVKKQGLDIIDGAYVPDLRTLERKP